MVCSLVNVILLGMSFRLSVVSIFHSLVTTVQNFVICGKNLVCMRGTCNSLHRMKTDVDKLYVLYPRIKEYVRNCVTNEQMHIGKIFQYILVFGAVIAQSV